MVKNNMSMEMELKKINQSHFGRKLKKEPSFSIALVAYAEETKT